MSTVCDCGALVRPGCACGTCILKLQPGAPAPLPAARLIRGAGSLSIQREPAPAPAQSMSDVELDRAIERIVRRTNWLTFAIGILIGIWWRFFSAT